MGPNVVDRRARSAAFARALCGLGRFSFGGGCGLCDRCSRRRCFGSWRRDRSRSCFGWGGRRRGRRRLGLSVHGADQSQGQDHDEGRETGAKPDYAVTVCGFIGHAAFRPFGTRSSASSAVYVPWNQAATLLAGSPASKPHSFSASQLSCHELSGDDALLFSVNRIPCHRQ